MIARRQIVIGLPALGLAACGRRQQAYGSVEVLIEPYFNAASMFLADESGYFADEGFHPHFQEFGQSQYGIPLLSGGQADVALTGVSASLMNAVARGARIRIVAGRQGFSAQCPDGRRLYGSLQAFPNGFTDFRQIKGKTVSLGRATTGLSSFLWEECLAAAGIGAADVRMLPLNDKNAAGVLLANGKIDVLLPPQEYDVGMTSLRERIVPGPSIGSILPGYMFGFVVFGKRFLDGAPAEGAAFLRAYFRGVRAFLAGKTPKFLDELASKDGFDGKYLRTMCREGAITDGHIPLADIQRYVDWAVVQKLTPAPMRAEDLVDLRFLKEARLQ